MPHRDRSDWSGWFKRGIISPGPIPTQSVSNEEFVPLPQTAEQVRVDYEMALLSQRAAKRLGLSRRDFLRTSGGMAAVAAGGQPTASTGSTSASAMAARSRSRAASAIAALVRGAHAQGGRRNAHYF